MSGSTNTPEVPQSPRAPHRRDLLKLGLFATAAVGAGVAPGLAWAQAGRLLLQPALRTPEQAGGGAPNPRTVVADGMRIDYDVAVGMRDGIKLYADVYRPADAAGKLPVLVSISPYGKQRPSPGHGSGPVPYTPEDGVNPAWASKYMGFEVVDPLQWTAQGYAVCFADRRGAWNSEGDAIDIFGPQEASDYYDLIEWLGVQDWSNGKVGTCGVSYYGVTQWGVAALRPPHLVAMAPFEALSDPYREIATHGGIPETGFWNNFSRSIVGRAQVEATKANRDANPYRDSAYWSGKAPAVENITIPVYALTNWGDHGLHTRGTIEAYRRVASKAKWLEVHGGKKWGYFHNPQNVARLVAFFDAYLKDGAARKPFKQAPVYLQVRENAHAGAFRKDRQWPPKAVRSRKLFLADKALTPTAVADAGQVSYDAGAGGHAVFDHVFTQRTELVGYAKLRLWIETQTADDADLFVTLQKLDRQGAVVGMVFINSLETGPVALGWLRASHRALDAARSTPEQPVHLHTAASIQPLTPGEPTPVEIEILASATGFDAGEGLRLIVGGAAAYKGAWLNYGAPVNQGVTTLHAGGRYDSHLLVPELPAKAG